MTSSDAKPEQVPPHLEPESAGHASNSWVEHPRTVERLQILVVVLGVILIAGFAAVIGRIVYLALQPVQETATPKVTTPAPATTSTTLFRNEAAISLPAGAKIEHMAVSADTLAIHYRNADGQGILIVDPATGETRQHLRMAPGK
jgi:uncharacterized protein DUF6476